MGTYNTEQRKQMLKQGKALPGNPPRFPIGDASDVKDAINLAKTPEERAHIYKHAKGYGMLGKIPSNWKPDGGLRGMG